MEFYADLDYISFYINNLYPSGVAIEIPTWLLVGSILFIYSIKLIKKDRQMASNSAEQLKRKAHLNKMGTIAGYNRDHYPKELKEKRNNDNK